MKPMGGGSRAAEDGDSPVRRTAAEDEAGTFPAGTAVGMAVEDVADNNLDRGH